MVYSEVTSHVEKSRATSRYAYDALGRRTVSQDAGGSPMRTLYDAFSFEVIREGETFTDGSFTTRYSEGIQRQYNSGTEGSRYRWIGEGTERVKTRSLYEDGYGAAPGRFTGISVTLYGRGEAVAVSRSASEGSRGGAAYLGKDILGSVRSTTNEYGSLEDRYEYDAFGKPYQGDLTSGMNLGYTGKPYDTATGLYNYGYRDYKPEAARFTTIDPVRDGANWFAYVNNDPVNWVDPWGEMPQAVVGAIVGFSSSTISEVGGRIASGQSFTQAILSTIHDPIALTNIATSTIIGALTAGTSSLLTAGATQAGKVAATNIAVNTVGGAVDSAAKTVIGNTVKGQPQNAKQTATAAVAGAVAAAVFSSGIQGVIAHNSMTFTTNFSNSYGVKAGTELVQPAWTKAAGIIGENILPAVAGIIVDCHK
jgi:RHS repeat-associated protein